MPNPQYTHLIFILDQSGSMSRIRDDAMGGLNTLAVDQEAQDGICTVSLVQFSTQVEKVYSFTPVGSCEPRTAENYKPHGYTALLDAVGTTVESELAAIQAMAEDDQPGLVSVVIITDGHENASSRFNRSRVRELLETVQEAHGWQVIYLGANQDSFSEAGGLGIDQRTSADFDANSANTKAMLESTSALLSRGRYASFSGTDIRTAMSYSAGERKSMVSSDTNASA